MKTKIVKIIIMLVVSMFLITGVSMAHDKNSKQYKSHGKAYAYHKKHNDYDHHPSWHKKHYKSDHPRYRHKHRYYKRSPRHDVFFFGISFIDPYIWR